MVDCLFCRIIQGQLQGQVLFRDDRAMVIRDVNPQAPTHVLIMPLEHIPSVTDLAVEQEPLLGYLFTVAKRVAQQEGVAQRGYRLLINTGVEGGQTIGHVHIHLFGGKALGPMLCKHQG